jgi:hypothetical protein
MARMWLMKKRVEECPEGELVSLPRHVRVIFNYFFCFLRHF